jgi:hypothetical protein
MITHLGQLREQAAENLLKKEMVFNPSKQEFELNILGYVINIPSREIKEMTHNQAIIVKRRLCDLLVGERGIKYVSPEILDELMKEIEVKI